MRRFKQLIAGRHGDSLRSRQKRLHCFEIPLKRWFGVASHLPADF